MPSARAMNNTLDHPEWLQTTSADGVTTHELPKQDALRALGATLDTVKDDPLA